MTNLDLSAFKARYGERWNYFMPPEGDPVSFIENSTALNTFTPQIEANAVVFYTAEIKAGQQEALVITHYSCIANAAVINPHWPGYLPTPLPAYAFQGRFAWTVVVINANSDDRSKISDVTYQNTNQFPADTVQVGKSLFKEYGTGFGDPPIIIPADSSAFIAIYALPDNRGAEPPPDDSPPIILTTEMVGFRLKYPKFATLPVGPQPQRDITKPRDPNPEPPGRRTFMGQRNGGRR